MSIAVCEFYDLVDDNDGEPPARFVDYFFPIANRSSPVQVSDVIQAWELYDRATVYTPSRIHGRITVMSIFRKDLFVSVALPVCIVVCGAYAFTWTSFTRVDDANRAMLQSIAENVKAQAVSAEQITGLTKLQQGANDKLDKVADQLVRLNTSLEVIKASNPKPPSE